MSLRQGLPWARLTSADLEIPCSVRAAPYDCRYEWQREEDCWCHDRRRGGRVPWCGRRRSDWRGRRSCGCVPGWPQDSRFVNGVQGCWPIAGRSSTVGQRPVSRFTLSCPKLLSNLIRIEGVRGSNPLSSTRNCRSEGTLMSSLEYSKIV